VTGKTVTMVALLFFAAQAHAQTNQGASSPAHGVTSGPASGSPTTMGSPQSGSPETRHQRDVVRDQSQSVRGEKQQSAHGKNDETGATGSSSPSYAPVPR
jgi:hypothetical protein